MRITIVHRTAYRYAGEVMHSAQYLRLTPSDNASQNVVSWRLDAPGALTPWRDAFGNLCHTLVVERPGTEIAITATGRVDTTDTNGVLPDAEGAPPIDVYLRQTRLTRADEAVRGFAGGFRDVMARDRLDGLHRLMAAIRERVDYRTGATHVQSTAAEVLRDRVGVCQDHAHLFIACCRTLGVPARYVGGYLYTGEAAEPFAAGHAWAAAWVDHLGWVSFDVANTTCGTERHVGVAVGLDYADAAPVRGVRQGGSPDEDLEVAVSLSAAQQ